MPWRFASILLTVTVLIGGRIAFTIGPVPAAEPLTPIRSYITAQEFAYDAILDPTTGRLDHYCREHIVHLDPNPASTSDIRVFPKLAFPKIYGWNWRRISCATVATGDSPYWTEYEITGHGDRFDVILDYSDCEVTISQEQVLHPLQVFFLRLKRVKFIS